MLIRLETMGEDAAHVRACGVLASKDQGAYARNARVDGETVSAIIGLLVCVCACGFWAPSSEKGFAIRCTRSHTLATRIRRTWCPT